MILSPAFELPAEAPGVVEQRATVPTVPAWIPDPQKPQETGNGNCCPEPLHFGAVCWAEQMGFSTWKKCLREETPASGAGLRGSLTPPQGRTRHLILETWGL